jgi:hypothetical protein
MNIFCNACGSKLKVAKVTCFNGTDINPCENCLKLAKLELIEDIENGRILLDEIRK